MSFQQSAWFLGKVCWICRQIVRELLLFCTSRTSTARRCTADDLLREGRGPGMPGPCRHLVRQFQFIHPPAVLGGDEADGAQRGCIRHNRPIPCPAREVLALTSQHDLIKCKATVRL